jgi:hypothetical protein
VPQELTEDALGAQVSADGSYIAYRRVLGVFGGREIWLMGSHGESPHKILTAGEQSGFGGIAWSPAGGRFAYFYTRQEVDKTKASVESCDLSGANKTTILMDDEMAGFSWISPRRFVHARWAGEAAVEATNLWELTVDKNGAPQGKSRRLTDWSGFLVYGLSATSDGKHLAFLRGTSHASVFVGDLASNGTRLLNPHRLTMDEYLNFPFAWTADSSDVIFYSTRGGNGGIYKQALGGTSQTVTNPSDLDVGAGQGRLSPDGAWVLFAATPHKSPPGTPQHIFRVSVNGGAAQRLFEVPVLPDDFYCANRIANFCAYPSRAADGRSWVITAFDPVAGAKGKELLRIPTEPGARYT